MLGSCFVLLSSGIRNLADGPELKGAVSSSFDSAPTRSGLGGRSGRGVGLSRRPGPGGQSPSGPSLIKGRFGTGLGDKPHQVALTNLPLPTSLYLSLFDLLSLRSARSIWRRPRCRAQPAAGAGVPVIWKTTLPTALREGVTRGGKR
jgi:hypothetical protein